MQILDQAVEIMRKRGANGAQVAASFEALAAVGEEAARVWQGYLDKPGATGDKYTLVSWMGPDRANQLFGLSLKAKTVVDEIRAATGPQARFLVLDESPIVLAYAGLKEGETASRAGAAGCTTGDEQTSARTGRHGAQPQARGRQGGGREGGGEKETHGQEAGEEGGEKEIAVGVPISRLNGIRSR
jgi:hypothetical protein